MYYDQYSRNMLEILGPWEDFEGKLDKIIYYHNEILLSFYIFHMIKFPASIDFFRSVSQYKGKKVRVIRTDKDNDFIIFIVKEGVVLRDGYKPRTK